MKFFILFALIIAYIYYSNRKLEPMSEGNDKPSQEEIDKQNFNPDNLIINMGGKQVPFSRINKPHNVVLDPLKHKPKVDANKFPDVEENARIREEERAAAHGKGG